MSSESVSIVLVLDDFIDEFNVLYDIKPFHISFWNGLLKTISFLVVK